MAETVSAESFRRAYLLLFEEIVGDPPKGERGNYVLDRDTGWVQTLSDLDAERASRPVAPGGTTIAGQTAHAAYYVELLERIARGERPEADWPGSFTPSEVDEAAWAEVRDRLLDALTRFRAMFDDVESWEEAYLGGALGVLVHTAYHLGAVRQMARVVARGA